MTRDEIRDGVKWAGVVGGGLAIGCLFALTGLAAWSAVAGQQAPPVPSHSHPDAEVRALLYIGSSIAFTVGIVWVVVSHLTGRLENYVNRMEARAEERLPELIAAAMTEAIRVHNDDEDAHGKAARLRHGPINGELMLLREEMETLIQQHREFHRERQARRDPLESPHARRASDGSGDDFRPLRGKGGENEPV